MCAKKTIGGLYAGHGAQYFLCYCPRCKESIYWNSQEATEFMQNASDYIHIRRSIFSIVRQRVKLPKIRVEWGSDTQLLTKRFEENIIKIDDTMKLKREPQRYEERNQRILEMRSTGKSIVDIGKYFNLSRQRVFMILKQYGDTLPKELAEGCE